MSTTTRLRFERGDQVELAIQLLQEASTEGELVFDEGALYRYGRSGLWELVDGAEQSRIIQGFAGAEVVGSKRPLSIKAADVTGAMKLASHRVAKPAFFSRGRRGLAFKNGFVEVTAEEIKLHPHSPDHRARIGYPCDYEPAASVARFTRFLCDLYQGDDDAHEKMLLLQEFAGSACIGLATRYQIALVLHGAGANGKSVLISTIVGVMPTGSCVAIPPQEWEQEYRRALLAGKLLNSVSELPEADIIASESFKAIISGDATTGRAIREAPFTFTPVAGHIFAANRLPGTNDVTEGFWRRIIVLRFNRSFTGSAANPNLVSELLTAERPGIVRWMLEGAQRVLQQGGYTVPASSLREVIEWRKSANPVALFLEEMTRDIGEKEQGTTASTLYDHYETWCKRNGHRTLSSTKFGERMKLLGRGSTSDGKVRRHPVALTGFDSTLTGYPSAKTRGDAYGYS